MKSKISILFCCLSLSLGMVLQAQDDLLEMLNELEEEQVEHTYATFKTVRIMNAHSIESPAPRVLTMIISHRFGNVNGGAYEFFGLDQANMRLGFDYGINSWLSIGVGRSNIRKTYDGFVKAKLLRQSTGKRKVPLSIAYVGATQAQSLRWANPDRVNYFSSRVSYSHQLLVARKFSEQVSLQLIPSVVHRNFVETNFEENDVYAMGAGGRIKITPSLTFNFEYFHLLPGYSADNFTNSLSLGMDIETGGHVFQLIFSNSIGMTENLFIAENTGRWQDGDIRFGFNLTRVFSSKKRKKKPKQAEEE